MNSPEPPSAAAPATSLPVHPDPAPPAGLSDDPAPGPDHPAGPVAPTARAAGPHQPTVRARLADGLLGRWQHRSLTASLPLALRQLEDAGNLDNLRVAVRVAQAGDQGNGDSPGGLRYRGPVFMDSDIYKTMEAIGWELAHGDRPELASFAAQVIALLEQAQRPDGYLNSYFQVSSEPRFSRLASSHEMYCAGYLIQAAAHPALSAPAASPADAAGAFPVTAIAIPYFQWDNRDGRGMRVWMPRAGG